MLITCENDNILDIVSGLPNTTRMMGDLLGPKYIRPNSEDHYTERIGKGKRLSESGEVLSQASLCSLLPKWGTLSMFISPATRKCSNM